MKLIEKETKRIYHTAGSESLSRYAMALKYAEIFNYKKALRPINPDFDITKLKRTIGSYIIIYRLEEGLKDRKTNRI